MGVYHICVKIEDMKVVTVIPLKKGLWKEDLTYFTAQNNISTGDIVSVPLRNKKMLGLVIWTEDTTPAKYDIKNMSFNLKKINEIKGPSVFLREYLDSAMEISKYNVESKNNSITSLIPVSLRENYDKITKIKNDAKDLSFGKKINQNLKSEKFLFQASLEDRISAYKTFIRGSFAAKKSVFIILPTEHDIKIFEESLAKGIEQFTITVHSKWNSKKIIKKFEQIAIITHPVLILGTAPYLSIPRNDLETIIVERESSSAYKTIGRPHFDLRIFVELFSSKINAKFILADTLLRYESIARIELDNFVPWQPMQYRINFEGEVKIENPNHKDDTQEGSSKQAFKILGEKSIEEIKNSLERKKNVFIFSLRKGLATETVCKDCGETLSCHKCGGPLVLYLSHQGKKRIFVCNRCETDLDGDTSCASCGSWNLMPLGIGTDTVLEEIEKIFPKSSGVKIFKIDRDSVKNTQDAEKIIKEYEENPGSILIGTEMTFFYLKNKVHLSIVASFDSLWSIPNFRMSEKIIQIALSILNSTKGKFIIQTKNENDPAILALQTENLLSFVREELLDRKKLNYPPYKRFIKVRYMGDKEQTSKARKFLAERFEEYSPEIFSGFVAKLKNKYVTNMLIKMDLKKWSLSGISLNSSIDENLLAKLQSLPPSFEIFVDPEDLL